MNSSASTLEIAPSPASPAAQTHAAPDFTEIVRDYASLVYRACFAVTRNSHDAEDAAQATFMSLADQLRQGAQIRHLGSWLQQVARRTSLDLYRSRTRRRRREDSVRLTAETAIGPVCAIDQAELAEIIRQELQHLPADYRTPLILHYYGELSSGQIARQLGCNAKALSMRLLRGRRMLADRLATRGIVMGAAALTAVVIGVIQRDVASHVVVPATAAVVAPPLFAALPDSLPPGFIFRMLQAVTTRPRRAMFFATILAGTAISGGGQYLVKATQSLDPAILWRSIDSGLKSLLNGLSRPSIPVRFSDAAEPAPKSAITPIVAPPPVFVAAARPAFVPHGTMSVALPHPRPPQPMRESRGPSDEPLAYNRFPDAPPTELPQWRAPAAFAKPVALLPATRSDAARSAPDGPDESPMVTASTSAGPDSSPVEEPKVIEIASSDSTLNAGSRAGDVLFASASSALTNGLIVTGNIYALDFTSEYAATSSNTRVGGIPEPTFTAPLLIAATMLLRRRRSQS